MPSRSSLSGIMSGLPGYLADIPIRYAIPSAQPSDIIGGAGEGFAIGEKFSNVPDLTASLPTLISAMKKKTSQPRSPIMDEILDEKLKEMKDKHNKLSGIDKVEADYYKDFYDRAANEYTNAQVRHEKGDITEDEFNEAQSQKLAAFKAYSDLVNSRIAVQTQIKVPTGLPKLLGAQPVETRKYVTTGKPTPAPTPLAQSIPKKKLPTIQQSHWEQLNSPEEAKDSRTPARIKKFRSLYPPDQYDY